MVAKLADLVFTRIGGPVAPIEPVTLGDDAERACGRQGTAFVVVELVAVIPVDDDLSFEPARELEAVQEDITGILTPFDGILAS